MGEIFPSWVVNDLYVYRKRLSTRTKRYGRTGPTTNGRPTETYTAPGPSIARPQDYGSKLMRDAGDICAPYHCT